MTDQLEQPSQVTETLSPSPSEAPPAFAIPDAYKDRGWVEKVKSPDDLWKTLDNAQSLLGKRPAGIPAADAPQADWDAYYKAARPESPDKYTLSTVDGLPEGFDLTPYKQLMYDTGLTPKQADALWGKYFEFEKGAVQKLQADLDKRFEETATKVLGDKREAASTVAQEAIKTYVSEGLRDSFVNNPEGMVAMIELANGYEAKLAQVRAEYGAEGKLPDGGQQVASTDINEVVQKQAKLRMQLTNMDFTKPEYRKIEDEIKALGVIVARHHNK